MTSNTINTIQVGEMSDNLSLEMHGATRNTIIYNLNCLADGANKFSLESTIRDSSALNLLDRYLHVLHQGKVYVGLCDGGQEGVACDGEWPLVHLEYEVLGS